MKKASHFVLGFLLGALLFGAGTAVALERSVVPNPFRIFVDGQERAVEAYLINDRTFLHLRGIAELFEGVEVDFTDGEIIINTNGSGDLTISNDSNANTETSSGVWIETINGINYVPALMITRPVSLGWDFPDGAEGQMNLVEFGEHTFTVVLENIPRIVHSQITFIPLTFYESTLRPLFDSFLGE